MNELRAETGAAWAIARKNLRTLLRYRLQAINLVLQPIYQSLIPSLLLGATFAVGGRVAGLSETAGTDDVAGFLVTGMMAAMLVYAGFWEVAFNVKLEMDAGTLEPAWLTPTRRETFVIGMTLGGVIVALVAGALIVTFAIVVLGAGVAPQVVGGLPALALAGVGILGIGYLIGAIVLRMRDANFFVDAADFIVVVLSGVAFPIVVLPDAVQVISYLLPTTYAVDLMRVHGLGTPPLLPLAFEWLALAATSSGLVVVGRLAWLRTERRLRIRGTLGQH